MTVREPALLALDLGTNEVKAGWSRLDGRLLGLARAGYPIDLVGRPGWAEQDPGAWWSAVVERGPGPAAPATSRTIVAIGVDGHGPTLVAVDERGEATRPAITWLDTRATAEAAELAAATGVRGWALGVACRPRSGSSATSRPWRPPTRWYLATWEWLAFRLAGVAVRAARPGPAGPGRQRSPTAPACPAGKLPPSRRDRHRSSGR